MISRMRIPQPVLIGIVALILLLAPVSLFAQGCALCYTQAASSTTRFIRALRSGILVLMVPPMVMSVGITVIAYRRRNSFRVEAEQADGEI